MIAGLPQDRAGLRLRDIPGLADLLSADSLGAAVPGHRPVRAILFDKSAFANWALGWHQDRTIAVRTRAEVSGFGPWSIKAGMAHVEPPFAIIERMRTVRVHLDDVDADNAPLLIAPGSHRLGRIVESEVDAVAANCGAHECLAERGDIWLYATPILHASAAASTPRRRRVLQIDFSAERLPDPLEWLGI
ncbi:phytanoyl-CoA dioxygenase family protein [Sphingomonas soli]|uniref:phytanoyl-CoA dioxygenase family protein n=1 Tax=Sphingomonas soli TaxID=266127 RepID=UPI001FDFA088|nr:phytanoyl-CoA dioxygenase family protein [Sphingomonas soli]